MKIFGLLSWYLIGIFWQFWLRNWWIGELVNFYPISGHPGNSFKAFKRQKVFHKFQLLRSFELVNKNVSVKVPPLFASTDRRKTFLGIKLIKLLHLPLMILTIKLECLSLASLLHPSLIFTGKVRGGFVEHISWNYGAQQRSRSSISSFGWDDSPFNY